MKQEYSITPNIEAGYSGNPFDPLDFKINHALGSFGAIPPYIILPKKDIITKVSQEDADGIPDKLLSDYVINSLMPLRVRRADDAEWFTFPMEPLVSISCKNVITRRNVAKSEGNGTIKERWGQDDYDVRIQGVITGFNENEYPTKYIKKIKGLFDDKRAIEVDQDVLLILGIKHLAIESINFPHTKGMNNQNFDIKAYSDKPVDLLISI